MGADSSRLPGHHGLSWLWGVITRRGGAPAGADQTPPDYSSSEEGDVTNPTVVVTFNEAVNSDTDDYVTGLTIKVNSVTQTLSSGTRQSNQALVYYVLATSADANDDITWEYSDALGNIEDLANNQLGDVTAKIVTNNINTHVWFDNDADSSHMVTAGVL